MINKIKKMLGIVTEKDMVNQIEETIDEICRNQIEDVRQELKELKGQ